MAARIFSKKSAVKLPERHKEPQHDEYGQARKEITMCRRCHGILIKNVWRPAGFQWPKNMRLPHTKTKLILCPACKMIESNLYEGELLILDVPEKEKTELLRLISAFSDRARMHDHQDRIIDLKKRGNGFRVTTTENQLAVKLGKKIRDTFKKDRVRYSVSYSQEPYEVARVRLEFTSS